MFTLYLTIGLLSLSVYFSSLVLLEAIYYVGLFAVGVCRFLFHFSTRLNPSIWLIFCSFATFPSLLISRPLLLKTNLMLSNSSLPPSSFLLNLVIVIVWSYPSHLWLGFFYVILNWLSGPKGRLDPFTSRPSSSCEHYYPIISGWHYY